MARRFTSASSEIIQLAGGAETFKLGPLTICTILKKNTDSVAQGVLNFRETPGVKDWYFKIENNDSLQIYNGSTSVGSATSYATVAMGWILLGISKATGTVAPRCHRYRYDTNAWDHSNSGSTLADSTASGAPTGFIGTYNGNFDFANYDMEIVGVWDRVLSDAEVENLPFDLMSWIASAPKGLWQLHQQAVTQLVLDITGNGANESNRVGTSVSSQSVPVWSMGGDVTRVERIPPTVVPGVPRRMMTGVGV